MGTNLRRRLTNTRAWRGAFHGGEDGQLYAGYMRFTSLAFHSEGVLFAEIERLRLISR